MKDILTLAGIGLIAGGGWWLHSGGLACVVVGILLLIDRVASEYKGRPK